jgi:S-adenosylmethionine:tRNA ribosyltransferase-isomerase
VSDFDYTLPEELIAQTPPPDRDGGRLLLVERSTGRLTDYLVRDLPMLLREHDLVVLNNTRVNPARLSGRRDSGGAVELLLLNRNGPGVWEALAKPARKMLPGTGFDLISRDRDTCARVEVTANLGDGRLMVTFDPALDARLADFGIVPLPPYIHHRLDDPERYQTVFSRIPGSAAAPTAGLHLSREMLEEIHGRGVATTEVTLQIGLDTFRPVMVNRVADHTIHREWCEIPAGAAGAIARCRHRNGRVVAIGTTSARTLESWGMLETQEQPNGWSGWTDVFITPGYTWTTVDVLLTNFHLPRSTLLMMIASFAGKELAFAAYQHAVEARYRFFSFGDAMLIV